MKRGTVLIFIDEYRSISPALLEKLQHEMHAYGHEAQLEPYRTGDMDFNNLQGFVPEPSYTRPRGYKDVPFWSRK